MDGRDVESGDGLHEDQPRLWQLLRGALFGTLSWVSWTSIWEDARAKSRIAHLRAAPASIRFLSLEPLLGHLGRLDLAGIDWVIAGGESGPGARAMDANWVRSIRDQCVGQGVAFFFKQWGGARKSGGRTLDNREWDEYPERRAFVAAAE
jgi:protein gp37